MTLDSGALATSGIDDEVVGLAKEATVPTT